MNDLATRLFEASPDIRYVAIYTGGEPKLRQRPGIGDSSGADTDRFEELLVNPAVLLLARQRGEIDCGGLEYVLIRYGHFFQLVHPIPHGHLSIAVEPTADPLAIVDVARRLLVDAGVDA